MHDPNTLKSPLARRILGAIATAALAAPAPSLLAQDADDAAHFGFDGLEVVKVDPNAGPLVVADFDGDGRDDIAVANNFKSRIELHVQKPGASPDDEPEASGSVNEVPPHWRYRRIEIPVSHQVTAMAPHDFDGDGRMDIVYAGQPGTIVFMRQVRPGVFEPVRRVPQKGLSSSRDGFMLADLVGDGRKDLAAIVGGQPIVWELDGTRLGDPVELNSGEPVVALLAGDFDGDGHNDLGAVSPDNAAPIRLWLASVDEADDSGKARLGAQRRFEMPPLREATVIRLPGAGKDLLARIERQSRRIVVDELVEDAGASREASLEVFSRPGSGKRRSYAIADIDGDGLEDVLVTDPAESAVVVYRQLADRGLQPGVTMPSFAEIDAIAAGDVDGTPGAEVFVLSEKEGVVGRSTWRDGRLTFPTAMPVTAGSSPTILSLVELEGAPRLAVVSKDGRNYTLELLPLGEGEPELVKLGSLVKAPDAILGLDADQDGHGDLLLFTADKPMSMVQAVETDGAISYELRESKDMPQLGLAQAAGASNAIAFDVDGDGREELVVADRNFIRALRYSDDESSPGWQVVLQMNARRGDAKLVALTASGDRLVAGDRENNVLAVFARGDGGAWTQVDEHPVSGFRFAGVEGGAFRGAGSTDLMLVGDDGFAVAQLDGTRLAFEEVASYRGDRTQQVDHELAAGDVNGDGFLDLLALDAGEQSLGVLSFSETGRLVPITNFRVFESRIFQGGEPREFEPSIAIVADVTGDGADDVVLLCHDRVLVYPQSVLEP